MSANDCPERDPTKIKILYKVNGRWISLGKVHPQFHGHRWHTVAYSGFNIKGTAFKFKVKSDGQMLQLGEIIFYQTLGENI